MEIKVKKIQSGKTTEIVEWVKEGRKDGIKDSSNRIIVIIHEEQKRKIMEKHELGYHEVETYRTIKESYYKPVLRSKELYLDDLDMALERYFLPATNIKGFSASLNN